MDIVGKNYGTCIYNICIGKTRKLKEKTVGVTSIIKIITNDIYIILYPLVNRPRGRLKSTSFKKVNSPLMFDGPNGPTPFEPLLANAPMIDDEPACSDVFHGRSISIIDVAYPHESRCPARIRPWYNEHK